MQRSHSVELFYIFDILQHAAVVLRRPTTTDVIIINVHDAISRVFCMLRIGSFILINAYAQFKNKCTLKDDSIQ